MPFVPGCVVDLSHQVFEPALVLAEAVVAGDRVYHMVEISQIGQQENGAAVGLAGFLENSPPDLILKRNRWITQEVTAPERA
jgi:hypothetical protein